MTPRERWLAVLAGEKPDRQPCDYWGTAEVTSRLMKDLGCADERALYERLRVDKLIHLAPKHRFATEDTWHMQSLYSIWHIKTTDIAYGEGIGTYTETIAPPLATATTVAEIDAFDWPDPTDWDTAGFAAQCEPWKGYPILGGCYEQFYLYCRLRGMEQALEDVVANPGIAEAILDHIFQIHYEVIDRTLKAAPGLVDIVYVAEDLGTQESLLMSPRSFRRHLKPRMLKMAEMVHSHGVKVFHHDDGAIRPLIPELIELGIDILNPIQWRCRGMEREGLARDFGPKLVFHGGVDNQHTMPFGSPEDVRREVADNIRIFSACRGYVVAPCHNLQANTPTANIVALYDAVEEFGTR